MSEVCDRAARLARTLADHGVGPETLVGICVERGTGMLAAMLGGVVGGRRLRAAGPGLPAGAAVRDGPRAPTCGSSSPTQRTAIWPGR